MKSQALISLVVMALSAVTGVQAAAAGTPAIFGRADCKNVKRDVGGDELDVEDVQFEDESGNITTRSVIQKRQWDGVSLFFFLYSPTFLPSLSYIPHCISSPLPYFLADTFASHQKSIATNRTSSARIAGEPATGSAHRTATVPALLRYVNLRKVLMLTLLSNLKQCRRTGNYCFITNQGTGTCICS